MKMLSGLLGLLLLCSELGCAAGRVADLKDSGRVGIGLALGLSADAKVGDLTHPSLGFLSSSAMVGFESRKIDGTWHEARVSEPFATYWYRQKDASWAYTLTSSGWRGVWESLDWLDAVDELDEPFDQEPLPETGTVVDDERLDERLIVTGWLPIKGGRDNPQQLWTFNTTTDLQVGATLLLIGGRLGFNPLEFVDFLLGFVGYDIAGDDPGPDAPVYD
jgi:hypothetical protein